MAGKGSKPRPMSISREEYDERFDRIFSNNKDKKQPLKKVKFKDIAQYEEFYSVSDFMLKYVKLNYKEALGLDPFNKGMGTPFEENEIVYKEDKGNGESS